MQALKKVPDFFIGGGEMGERMRNFDWNNTPLGAPENWDQALKTSLSICLNSNFPIALYWGKELTLLYNDAWSPIPGNKHPWALGKPAKEVWKDIWKEIEPEFKKAFEGIPGGSKDALLPMQRHGYTEECYFDFTFTPVTGTLGKVEGVFNAVIETTYRVISERRSNFLNQLSLALASANTQEKVFEQLNIFFKQNNTPVSFAFFYSENNGARNLFASTHNIKELHFKKQLPFKKVLELKKILLVERIHDYLESVPKGYWDEEPVEAVILPIADLNTSITHFIVCGLNARHRYDDDYKSFFESLVNIITKILNTIASLEQERKRAEALAEIDKAKTLFFTNISHEFRTPLTLMLGPIEEVLNDSTTNPANANRLALAHRNAMRLLKLVNALLDFSRIESGRQKTNFKLTDIVAFTKNLVSNFRSATEKAGLKLIVKANNNLPAVYVDRDMWEKIVFNLLSNAFKYTLKGSITVEITAQNNNAVLKIKDTGIGIPENELPRIFERFHRVQNIAGRSFEGTGIGLSLTKELVLLNRGKIFVESKEGVGSTFTVTVPFGKEHIDASEIKNDDGGIDNPVSEVYVEEASILLNNTSSQIETGNQLKNENQSKPLVIIVDDNIDMRKHIETLLSPKFNIVTAVNGADALKKLKHAKPELILSDIMMPVMDGIQLLTEIKNNKETEHIPVVLLTARAGEESKIEGWETGADDYLVKPFTAKELIARIEAQIKLKRKRDTALQSIYNIFREVPFAVAVLKGEDLIIEFINQYNLDIWQCKKDEVINKPLFEVRPDLYETAAPIHAEVYRTGKRFSANEIPLVLSANGKIETRYFNTVIDP
jgi:signal transduction histidine kinase/ActR/RegA family two-component response regulator